MIFVAIGLWIVLVFQVGNTLSTFYKLGSGGIKTDYPVLFGLLYFLLLAPLMLSVAIGAITVGGLA